MSIGKPRFIVKAIPLPPRQTLCLSALIAIAGSALADRLENGNTAPSTSEWNRFRKQSLNDKAKVPIQKGAKE